ncbi:hydrolase [Desulfuribacillus stibiiarsenatis]|uniref:Hydrolase n=1 Tax=Desulfuribacillus stibiiarsenatis TaxID=1390249 RepID=A0A1E5L7Q2_9FIRM|nr:hydrolase [Desulfuribacillus stibiiarsenatis]OEH86180.1 hydrolase [Desulfuribacillus stibiiarsenatis]
MLSTQDTVLVVIDIQEKLVKAMKDQELLIQNVQKMIQGAQVLEIPIIALEQYPEGIGATVPEITALVPDWSAISKNCFNCGASEEFINTLTAYNRKQVLLVGIEAHICVYQTALDLKQRGYDVEVVIDAISSRTELNLELAIDKLSNKGIGVTSVEMSLFELLGKAEGEQFKKILKIIK